MAKRINAGMFTKANAEVFWDMVDRRGPNETVGGGMDPRRVTGAASLGYFASEVVVMLKRESRSCRRSLLKHPLDRYHLNPLRIEVQLVALDDLVFLQNLFRGH